MFETKSPILIAKFLGWMRRLKRSLKNWLYCLCKTSPREVVFIFGDSHGRYGFEDLGPSFVNLSCNSITMFRVGRDGIPFFCKGFARKDNSFIFCYGEIDCRNHIARQIKRGRTLEEIIEALVSKYFWRISESVHVSKKILVCSLPPPASFNQQLDSTTEILPFAGTAKERSFFAKKINEKIRSLCGQYGYAYLDIYSGYHDSQGLLKAAVSDGICHIIKPDLIHVRLKQILGHAS